MLYSGTCAYAIRALTRLALCAAEPGRRQMCRVQDVAQVEGLPRHFLGKVFQTLAHTGIVRSAKGPHGGFALAKPAREITLIEIVAAMDGTSHLSRCAAGLERCSDHSPCPHHQVWKSIRNEIQQYLQQTTLHDIAQAVEGRRPEGLSGLMIG